MAQAGSPGGAKSGIAALEVTMANFLRPEAAIRKPAEEQLKAFLRNPSAAGTLLQVTQESTFPEARQMAALFLRKKINTYWIKLNDAAKTFVKQTVLARMAAEPFRPTRRALSGVAAALAKHLLPANQWPELPKFIHTCSQASSPTHLRELGMLLLRDMIEIMGTHFSMSFESLRPVLAAALADNDASVRYAALRAVALIITLLSGDEQVMTYKSVIPTVFVVIKQAVDSGDDNIAIAALDAVALIAESSVPVLNTFTKEVFAFLLQLLQDESVDVAVKDCCGQVIINLITTRPKAMVKAGVVPHVLAATLRMATQYDEEEYREAHAAGTAAFSTGGSGVTSTSGVAERILDKLAIGIPSQHVLPPLMQSVMPALSHADWKVRRAALVALAMVAEGCVAPMREKMDSLLPLLLPRIRDENQICRSAACWTLGQWSQYLKPTILEYHDQILPLVFALLRDGSDEVKNTACFVLETFCEELEGDAVVKYLDRLMESLGGLMTSANINVREMAVSALGSVVIAAKEQFVRFFPTSMKLMLACMKLTDDESLSLRARATDCVGHIAFAVGAEKFLPYLQATVHEAMQGLLLENPNLVEYTFLFFGQLAAVLGEDFQPFLSSLVPLLMDSIRSEDGVAYTTEDGDHMGEMVDQFDDQSDGDDDDDDDDEEAEGDDLQVGQVVRVRTAVLDLKSAAATTLGLLAEHCGATFGPYIADACNLMLTKTNYFHEDLRRSCWTGIGQFVLAALKALPPTPPSREVPYYRLHPDVQSMIDNIITGQMVTIMQTDDDKEVVARCCDCLILWLKAIGVAAVGKHMKLLTKVVVKLLKERTVCQRYEPDEDEDEDGPADHDLVLIDTVSDLIAALAMAYGAAFAPHFALMLPPLLKYCRPARPWSDRSMAVGLFAEVAEAMGAAITPHLPAIWPAIARGLKDMPNVRRNSAFATGHLLSAVGVAAAAPCIPQALQLLGAVLTDAKALPVVKDNAAGALARMATKLHTKLPLDKVLAMVVAAVPTAEDFEENKPCFMAIVALLAARKPEAMALMPQIMTAFAKALSPTSHVAPDVQAQIVTCLKNIAGQFSEQLGKVFTTLPADQQAALTAALSSSSSAAPPSPVSATAPSPPR